MGFWKICNSLQETYHKQVFGDCSAISAVYGRNIQPYDEGPTAERQLTRFQEVDNLGKMILYDADFTIFSLAIVLSQT